jgi:general secretion pathway protein E
MTGFRGRTGIYELLTVSEEFRALVTPGVSPAVLRRQAVVDGMKPLRLAGALRAAEGVTTLEEVVAATPPL